MFKLAATVRNHLIVVLSVKGKAPSPRRFGPTLVLIVQSAVDRWRFPVSRLMAAARMPKPGSSMVSLAGKAPTVCQQLPRIDR